jgi:hypothetical protein
VLTQHNIAAGRSSYIPLVENDSGWKTELVTEARTRIVVLSKIDQFYEMTEQNENPNNRF